MSHYDRDHCLELLKQYTKNPNLIKHALAVEAVMRAYAGKSGEDEAMWGAVGLLHDFDYEMYPTAEDHPSKGVEILKQLGYPEEFTQAILGHASHTNVERQTLMAKTLFAVDELAGFIVACALVQPNKTLAEVKPKSVKKKLKDKAFARSVNRQDISRGVEELGVDLTEHITFVCDALKTKAIDLDL